MSGTPQAPHDNGNGNRNGGAGPHAGADPHGHVNAHTGTDGHGNGAGGAEQYGSDPYAPHGQHVPRSWGGGEYDADATAFVQLPSGGFDFAEDAPLAAPGTGQGGYTPPPIDPSSQPGTPGSGTLGSAASRPGADDGSAYASQPPAGGADQAAGGASGHWVMPFAPENAEQGAGGPGQPELYGQSAQYGHSWGYDQSGDGGGAGAPEPGQAAPGPQDTLGGQGGPGDHGAGGALGQGAAAALAGSHEARTGRRPLGTGVARAANADEKSAPSAPGSPASAGSPASPGPSAPTASGTPAPGGQEREPARAWAPSSPTAAPHWDRTAPGGTPRGAGPGPLPQQEPGSAEWPFEGAPGGPAPAYGFPGGPSADQAPAPSEETQRPEVQPGAEAGIVAGEPPAPPAGPESQTDSEVTSLAEAAPAPAPAPQSTEPAPGTAAQPDAAPEGGAAETGQAEHAADDTGAGTDTATDTVTEPGTDAAPEAGSEGASGTGPEADGDATPLPEAVDTEDEHPHVSYVLRVNGVERPVASAWIGESLLYVLRERLGLAGAKDGCAQGECGACSVQVDGRLVAACLVPAATAAGSEVRTVEGLSADGTPSDVQCALAESGSVQCGFCVPGLAMTVHDLLEGNHAPTELETRKAISGNLCRCSGYRGVLDAVRTVVEQRTAQAERDAAEAEAQAATGRQPSGRADYGQGGYDPQGGYGHGGYEQQADGYEQQSGTYEQQPGAYEQGSYEQGGGYGPGGYEEGAAYGGVPYEQGGYGPDAYGGPQGGGYDYDPAAQAHTPEAPGAYSANGTYDDGTYGAHIPHQTRHSENGGES
ncbi:2Fe-2S iron-sulfur cluster-binding protein [Streptomyces sp. 3N207]|uniref:2Fe-2S iron-sulfur cluster-binding protein n=1 Tax=Streptomyces sp. 3N207 TaxID=3457417 RepID=UPI003FD1511C